MQRWKKILAGIGIAMAVITLLIAMLFMLSLDTNVGRFAGDESGFEYDGNHYSRQKFQYGERGKRLGGVEGYKHQRIEFKPFAGDGVYAIAGDDDHNFLYVTMGFRALKACYVRDGIVIPSSGTVTEVYNDFHASTTDATEIAMFQRVASLTGELTAFEAENLGASQREFYFAYDNWPVAVHTPGSIVYAEGNFFFVKSGDSSYTSFLGSMAGTGEGIVISDPELLDFKNVYWHLFSAKENPLQKRLTFE